MMDGIKKTCLKLLPYRIWQQVLCIMLIVTLGSLLVLGFLLIGTSREAVRTTVFRDYKQIADYSAIEIMEFVKSPQKALKVVSSIIGTLHAKEWQQETVIVELGLSYPMFSKVVIVGVNGDERVTSRLGENLLNRTNDEAFLLALKGREYISDVWFSDNDIPMLTMSAPIRSMGKISSVIIADVSLRELWGIIERVHENEGSYVVLFDQNNRVIAHKDKKKIFKKETLAQLIPEYGESIEGQEIIDLKGEKWLFSSARIPELNWSVFIFYSSKYAFSFSRTMKSQAFIIIFICFSLSIMMSIVLARLVSRPMDWIRDGMKRLGDGDYDFSFQIKRQDEIGKLLSSFNKMKCRLKEAKQMEKLSALGHAAASIAHELKNSLVLVETFVQLLPKRYKDKKFIDDFSESVPHEMQSWRRMFQNMTDCTGMKVFHKTNIEIETLIKHMEALVQHQIKLKKIALVVEVEKDMQSILGDGGKLNQAFLNLMTNAIEATPENETIYLFVRQVNLLNGDEKEYIEVEIVNPCSENVEDGLNRLFEPLYTTKVGGVGLGLSIAAEIIKLHGGELSAKMKKGNIEFIVRLPVYRKMDKGEMV